MTCAAEGPHRRAIAMAFGALRAGKLQQIAFSPPVRIASLRCYVRDNGCPLCRSGCGKPVTRHRTAELVCSNLQEYETLALKLALAPVELTAIRLKLESNRLTYPVFDTDSAVRYGLLPASRRSGISDDVGDPAAGRAGASLQRCSGTDRAIVAERMSAQINQNTYIAQ